MGMVGVAAEKGGLVSHLMLRVGWKRRLQAKSNVWDRAVNSNKYM